MVDGVESANCSSSNLGKYQCKHPFAVGRIGSFFDSLAALVGLVRPSRVLSIGCGEGLDLGAISERVAAEFYCCGLDLSLETLRASNEVPRSFRLDAVNGNAHHVPLRLDGFDLVLCLEVLEHMEQPEQALRDLSRRYNGYCIFSVPNEPLYRLTRLLVFGQDIKKLGDHPEHVNHWSKAAFARLVRRYFSIHRVVTPFPWVIVLCHTRPR